MTAPVHLTRPSEEEAEIFLIDLELMASIFRKNLPLIVCTTVLMMAISCAYALFVYRENFTSSATILLNLDALPDENTEKANLTNPFITQETFLNSPYMMEAVSLAVREPDSKKPLAFNSSITPTQLSKDLKAFHIKETSFIKLQADANSPKRAKTLLEAYLSTYIHELDTITSSPMNQTFAALNKQLADSKKKLAETNQALNEFQKQYGLIDVDAETQLLVKTVDRLERTKEEVEEQIAAKHAEIERLSSQLNLDTETAIASAAKGQNLAYIKLVQDLNDAEQDYAIKSLTYAPTNPNLKKLKQKVDVLREQIDKMSLQMVGERHANNNIVISDDVRRDLVTELAVTEADYAALQQRLPVVQQHLQEEKTSLQGMPDQHQTYAQLMFDRAEQQKLVKMLTQKLQEFNIKRSLTQDTLSVVDTPRLPTKPSNLNRFSLMIFLMAASLLIPTSVIILVKYMLSPVFLDDRIRSTLNTDLFRIPITNSANTLLIRLNQNTKASRALAPLYKSMIMNFKLKSLSKGQNTLAMVTSSDQPINQGILMNMIEQFAAENEPVLVIDLNEHKRLLGDTDLGPATMPLPDIPEGMSENVAALVRQMPAVADSPNVYYLGTQHTTKLLHNGKEFQILISELKTYYKWILVLTSPLLESYAANRVLLNLDGIVLILGSQKHLIEEVEQLRQQLEHINTSVLGTIIPTIHGGQPAGAASSKTS